ncbi:MAG: hypothetical protein HY869_06605 [Chloroflexi bacterium]|nr:hypothetical protein [Chloroflexota bacterium]
MKKKSAIISVIFIIILFFYWLFAPCAYDLSMLSSSNMPPKLISEVWPQEKTNLACYYTSSIIPWSTSNISGLTAKRIGIKVDGLYLMDVDFVPPFPIDESKNEWDHPLNERVNLYLDGEKIPASAMTAKSFGEVAKGVKANSLIGPGVYIINWSPNISLGNHIARIEIFTLSGEIVEYEWDFIVTLR